MEKPDPSGKKPVVKEAHFGDKTTTKLSDDDVSKMYYDASEKILESMAKYQKEGSGWRLKKVLRLEIHTTEYNPVGGSSHIPLPEKLKGRRAIINMKNEDNECFKWSVTRALNPVDKNSEWISKELRKQSEELDWSMLTFPVVSTHNNIKKFEQANDIGVNIFGYENGSKKEGIRQGVYPRMRHSHTLRTITSI